MTRKTGYVFEEHYLWHDPGSVSYNKWTMTGEHWENKDTKHRFHSLLSVSGVLQNLVRISARHATRQEIACFHTEDYIDKVIALSAANGGETGEVARLGPHGYEIATLSAGGVLAAVEAVIKGEVDNAYCLVRPPGHHAEKDRGMGFCIFNNVVIGAHLAKKLGRKRVAIVDYDVHHGNGTEQAFIDDPDTLFISLHQDNNYPVGTGDIIPGNSTTINVPLPPGSGTGAYEAAFRHVVIPAIENFKPDLIIVSSGFDASYVDPLASMMLSSDAYRNMAAQMIAQADKHCQGKIIFAHEGGYSKEYVPFCGLAVVEELLGERAKSCVDVSLHEVNARGYQPCQPHQLALIKKVVDAAGLPSIDLGLTSEELSIFETLQAQLSGINSKETRDKILASLCFQK